jgi:AcrR family transcriptional regulator
MSHVKRPRSARDVRAEATRARMIRAAYELFCADGHTATTMQRIADRAGVAVQTVYFTFHTKDELLQAVHEWAVLGDDPTIPAQQPGILAAMDQPDGREALRLAIAGIAEIEARVAPLIPVYHAVASSPAGAVFRRSEELRREGMAELAAALAAKTSLQTAMTLARASDLLFVLTGPEVYRSFVQEAGWSQDQWIEWMGALLVRELFDSQDPGS